MSRGLDHIVHAVRDLDAAADFYRRAGFTVGARNRHPWGTHNHVVQFPGFFIEILTVEQLRKAIAVIFARKGEAVVEANLKAFDSGVEASKK